jgi:hypothetical protein
VAKGSKGKERLKIAIAVLARQRNAALGGGVTRVLERGGKRVAVGVGGQLDRRLVGRIASPSSGLV